MRLALIGGIKAGAVVLHNDFGAGIRLHAKYGDEVRTGDPMMTLYAASESQLDEAEAKLQSAVEIAEEHPEERPLIRKTYSTGD